MPKSVAVPEIGQISASNPLPTLLPSTKMFEVEFQKRNTTLGVKSFTVTIPLMPLLASGSQFAGSDTRIDLSANLEGAPPPAGRKRTPGARSHL